MTISCRSIRDNSYRILLTILLAATATFLAIILWSMYLKYERKRFILGVGLVGEDTSMILTEDTFDEQEIETIATLKETIDDINREQPIYNVLKDPIDLSRDDFTVIVIQVSRSPEHLFHLLSSLSNVHGFDKLLLIFSHEYFDQRINKMLGNVTKMKYIPIYYPHSTELHNNTFPGPEPMLCNKSSCAETHHVRDWYSAQQKHFWWWTVSHVFDRLVALHFYDSYIVFIEDRTYAAKDLIHMIKLMSNTVGTVCPECDMLNFGALHPSMSKYHGRNAHISIKPFGSSPFTSGIAFNRTTWYKIKALKNHFCYFNDSSWVESLKNLGLHTPSGKFLMYSCIGPRIFDTTDCATSFKDLVCEIEGVHIKMTLFMKLVWRGLYPKTLLVKGDQVNVTVQARGGWEDVRDRDLCRNMDSEFDEW